MRPIVTASTSTCHLHVLVHVHESMHGEDVLKHAVLNHDVLGRSQAEGRRAKVPATGNQGPFEHEHVTAARARGRARGDA